MMKKITLFIFLLAMSIGYAQQSVVQDFETGTDGLGDPFGSGAAEIVADPATNGTRGQVAKLIATSAGNIWQGININMTNNIALTSDKTMQIDIYSEDAISIAPRVQGGVDGAPTSTAVVSHTGSGWETLTVTFNTGSNDDAAANGVYSEFVIYYLWDTSTGTFIDPAIDRVFYADNITGIIQEEPSEEKELVQDFETGTDGLGDPFGGGAAEIVADPATGGTRGQVAKLIATAAGNVWQGININMTNNIVLTSDKTMQIDIYSDDAISIAPRVQGGLDGAPTSTAVVSHTGSGWETLTITFDTGSNDDAVANGVYSEFVIYYLWDTSTGTFIDPAIDRVFYADNILGTIQEELVENKDLVQDFETGTDGLGDPFGGGAAEIVADPATDGTRGQVAKLIATAAGNVWQGININMTNDIVLTSDKTMQIDIYSDDAISIAPRVQGGLDGAPISTAVVSHTGSGWETLTITFDTGSNSDAVANGVYSEFVIYYLWDTSTGTFIDPAIDRVFYADNITGIIQKELVQDFETGTDGLGDPFGSGAAEIVADPAANGTRGQVAKLIATAAGNVWQGLNINMTSNIRLVADKTMEIDVYSDDAISIAPRVQGGLDGAPISTAVVSHTGSGWETLTITFDTGSNSDAVANGVYSEFVIYYLWDTSTGTFIDPAIDRVFYVDNIRGIRATPTVDASLPATAAPSPTNSDATILSIYNDTGDFNGVAQIWSQEYDFGTNQGNKDLDPTDGVNNALKMDFSVAGWGAGRNTVTDISNQTHLHFDYYAPTADAGANGHEFKFIIIGEGQGEKDYTFKTTGGDGVIEFGEWVSVNIPLSHFEDLGFTKDQFLQFKLGSTSDLNTKVVYFDNIYFYNEATAGVDRDNKLSVSLYPNPTKNELNISSKNKIESVIIYNILGKKVKSFAVNALSKSLDVSNLSKGIYILKYTSNNAVGSMKFAKE